MKELVKLFLKKLGIYHPLQTAYRSIFLFISNQYYKAVYRKYKGKGFTCNFCEASYEKFIPGHPSSKEQEAINNNEVIAGFGENVFCPRCMSKNRERLIKDVIQNYLNIENRKILHFSPEKNLYRFLKNSAQVVTVDIAPGFYLNIDKSIVYADATALRFEDKSFDFVIANHILEHIPEDVRAMKEIFRVLKNDGAAILQVPYSEKLRATIEDPYINDPVRQELLYGQKDHVRIYALNDYINRLEGAGFNVRVLTAEALAPFRMHAIQDREHVFMCYKKG